MLDNLMDMVREFSQKTVADNSAIPADKKEETAQTLASSLVDGLKSQASQGNLTDLFDIFSKKETSANNSAMSGIQSTVTNMISQKNGLSSGSGLASLIPTVLSMLGNKAGDPNDSGLDFNGLFSMISGGKSEENGIDANTTMNRLDDDNDGFGLDDIASMLGGKGGDGIMGALGGLFGGK